MKKDKYYLLYENNKFKGFTDNKKLKNKFLDIRNDQNNYECISIKKDKVKDIHNFYDDCELISHNGYDYRYPIFEYEWDIFEPIIREQTLCFDEGLRDLLFRLSYLKLDKEEALFLRRIIMELIETIEVVINTDHDVILDEVFDMEKYFKYLNRGSIYPKKKTD